MSFPGSPGQCFPSNPKLTSTPPRYPSPPSAQRVAIQSFGYFKAVARALHWHHLTQRVLTIVCPNGHEPAARPQLSRTHDTTHTPRRCNLRPFLRKNDAYPPPPITRCDTWSPPRLTCSRKFPRILSLTCSAPLCTLVPLPHHSLAQAFFPLLDLLLAFAQLFINSRPTNKQLYDVVMVSGILNAHSISKWGTACARVKLFKRAVKRAADSLYAPIFPSLKIPILRGRRSSIHANE